MGNMLNIVLVMQLSHEARERPPQPAVRPPAKADGGGSRDGSRPEGRDAIAAASGHIVPADPSDSAT